MNIVLARIDNRLVHGQVIESWVPYTHANCIVVANDELACASLRRRMMEASVPKSLKLIISTVEEVGRRLVENMPGSDKVLLLFATSEDALRAHRHGVRFSRLNLGNMHQGRGKFQLSCTIHLDKDDIENLQALEHEGVEIISRCVPADRAQNWKKLIRNFPG